MLQLPSAATVTLWSDTSGPEGVAAGLTSTRTVPLSPVAVPALPETVKVAPTRALTAGWAIVTVGAVTSGPTVNLTGGEVPVSPPACCEACTV